MAKKAAVVIFDGFEELEAAAPADLMRRAGIEVEVLTLTDSLAVRGRNSIEISADARLCDRADAEYDAVAISGGPGTRRAMESAELIKFARRHFESGAITAAICAAPLILKKAGILAGRPCAAHPSAACELENVRGDAPVVRDANVITSRGAGTAVEFGLALVEALAGRAAAEKTAETICFQNKF